MRENEEEADDQESPEDESPTRAVTIRDNSGENYRLEWWAADYGWSYWLFSKSGFKIGYAHTQLREDVLFLADLRINDEVPTARSGLRMFLERIGWARRRTLNYQRRGLAKQILVNLEAVAVERGYREIIGGIVTRDIASWPGLPDWYRRRGYSVYPKPADSTDIGELAIRKTLIAAA